MLSTHVAIASIPNIHCVIVDATTKQPVGPWQHNPASAEDVAKASLNPNLALAIVPASIGLVAVDHDQYPRVGARELTETLPTEALVAAVESRGEGRKHYYYRHDRALVEDTNAKWYSHSLPMGELRTTGYIILWNPDHWFAQYHALYPKASTLTSTHITQLRERGIPSKLAQALSSASIGQRNDTLNTYVHDLALNGNADQGAINLAQDLALDIGLDPQEVADTIASAVSAGSAQRTAGGSDRITKTAAGLDKALRGLGVELRYNLRSTHVEQVGMGNTDWRTLTDHAAARLREMIATKYKWDSQRAPEAKFGKESWADALDSYLHDHRVDPFLSWLQSLTWDGVNRLDTMLTDALGVPDNPQTREISSKFLIGAVARTDVEDEAQIIHDWMPLIGGAQGCGKSSFLRELASPQYFCENLELGQSAKEVIEVVGQAVIVEIAELIGSRNSSLEKIKHFITRQEDVARAAYGHFSTRHTRRWVMAGTFNDDGVGILPYDNTGQRRFAVVRSPLEYNAEAKTGNVRTYLQTNRTQLWAEAYHRWVSANGDHSSHLLSSLTQELIAEDNAALERRPEMHEDSLEKWLSSRSPEPFTMQMVMLGAGFITDVSQFRSSQADQNIVSKLLTEKGFSKRPKRTYVKGKQGRYWDYPAQWTPTEVPEVEATGPSAILWQAEAKRISTN